MSKFLIVGLGNIGATYVNTRHNIGFDVVDAFVAKHEGSFRSDRLADMAEIKYKGRNLTIIKPTTYMNLSGKAVKYWMDKEKIQQDHILVIVDELALPLDKVRIRPSGSAAGHNGLSNIQECLGSDQYPRLRFGIGNQFPKGGQVDFVLGKWNAEEWPLVKLKIEKSVEIIETVVFRGLTEAMNQWNKVVFTL